MMRHCSPDVLVAVAEGAEAIDAVPHLAVCEECRAQVAELRAMTTALADVAVPEPSPLFWEQFGARVRAAVTAEPVPVVPFSVRVTEWVTRHPMWPAVAAVAAIGLLVLVLPSRGPGQPGPAVGRAAAPSIAGRNVAAGPPTAVPASEAEPDALLDAFIANLADGVDVDAAVAAGLTPERGAMDAAVNRLSGDEQRELQRLLQDALSQAGA